MQIINPEIKRYVEEYDFMMDSGLLLPVTIDLAQGDNITFDDHQVKVVLTGKKSPTNPEKFVSAEDITIFTRHLVSVQHRTREIVELTVEQQLEWSKTLKGLTGTVQ